MVKKNQHQVPRIIYMAVLIIVSLVLVSPFVIPVILAGTIALALYPVQIKLERRQWKKRYAAALITTVFTFLISIPFLFFVIKGTLVLIDQLERFALGEKLNSQGMQQVAMIIRNDIITGAQKYLEKIPFANFLTDEKLSQYLKSANVFLLQFFQSFAANIPMVTLFFLVMIFCTFSFLKNAAHVREFFQALFGFNNRKMDQLVGVFLRDTRQVYLSNIVTGTVQSTIVSTGVYFVTKADWFLVFFVTLIFSFIPVIGAAPIAFLFAVVAFFQGNTSGAIILVVVGSFAGIIDNFLRPWLASYGESKAPPIVSFVFVIGGALMLGFPGLFLGLLMGSIAYDTLPIFWEEVGKSEGKRKFTDLFTRNGEAKLDGKAEDVSIHPAPKP